MRDLAIVKIGLRTQFVFPNAPTPHPMPLERHWLAYPITRHGTKAWKGSWRLPNSLRFKVRPDNANPKKLRGVIFHVPCRPPQQFDPTPSAIAEVWKEVHALLDELTRPGDKRGYATLNRLKEDKRQAMRRQLDELHLERIPL